MGSKPSTTSETVKIETIEPIPTPSIEVSPPIVQDISKPIPEELSTQRNTFELDQKLTLETRPSKTRIK